MSYLKKYKGVRKFQKGTLIPKNPAGTMKTFMEPSNTSLASYNLQGDALTAAEGRLKENYMLDDVINEIPKELSLNTIMTGDDVGTAPEDRIHMTVDTVKMAEAIENDLNLGYDDRKRYLRTIQVIDGIQKSNLTITKAPSGRYWLESNEDGTRHYAKNSILEVADLLDKYSVGGDKVNYTPDADPNVDPSVDPGKTPFDPFAPDVIAGVDKAQAEQAEIDRRKTLGDKVLADTEPYALKDYEKWKLGALATDIVSTLGGIAGKVTGIGIPVGMAINVAGGLTAAGMEAWGDYNDPDVTMSQMWKGLGLRLGAEAVETFTGVPASVGFGIRKAIPIVRRFMGAASKAGAIDMAMSAEWNETLSKPIQDWGIADYRKMAFIVQIVMAGTGAHMAGKYKAKKDLNLSNKRAAESDIEIQKSTEFGTPTKKEQGAISRKLEGSTEPGEIKTIQKKSVADVKNATIAKKQTVDNATVIKKPELDATIKRKIIADEPTPYKPKPLIKRKAIRNSDTPAVKKQKRLVAKQNEAIKQQNALKKKRADRDKDVTAAKLKKAEADNKAKVDAENTKAKADAVKKKAEIDKIADSKVKDINKTAGAERKKLVAKKQKETQTDTERTKREKETVRVEKEVEKAFGSPSKKMKKKAKIDAYGEARAKKLEERQASIESSAKTAKTKLGKAKAEADKMEKQIAKNKDTEGFDTEAKQRELAKQQSKVTRLQKISDNWFVKTSKKLVAKGVTGKNAVGTGAKRVTNTVIGTNYQGVGDRAQRASLLAGDTRAAIVGDKDYEYDEKESTRRLVSNFGFTTEELKGFSAKQLSELVKREEGRAKGTESGRYPAKVRATLLRQIKGRDTRVDIKRKGGKLRLIAKPGTVIKAQAGITTVNTTIPDFKNSIIQGDFNNWYMENKEEYDNMTEVEKLETQKAFMAKHGRHSELSQKPYNNAQTLLKYLQPSDFMKRSRAVTDTYALRNFVAPTSYAAPVTNMPGFKSAMHELDRPLRVDTADSFQAAQMKTKTFNERLRNKVKLIAKNAEYIDRAKAKKLAVRNTNDAAQVQAYNQNMAQQNAADAHLTQQENAARTQAATENNARRGRVTNAFWKGASDIHTGKRKDELSREFNRIAGLKNKWDTEYAPRIQKALAGPDPEVNVGKVKNEFITNNDGYNPDFFITDMENLKRDYGY